MQNKKVPVKGIGIQGNFGKLEFRAGDEFYFCNQIGFE